MTDAVVVRPATLADIPAIAAIYDEAVLLGTASFELDPPGEAEMRLRMRTLLDGGFPYLVAMKGNVLAGYAYAGPYRLRPAYRFAVEDSIYVAPDMYRGGVGTALLAALIAASEQRGYRQMLAVIGDSANAGSIALHARAGFYPVGAFRDVGYKFGRWLDSVMMQRPLGEGANTAPNG
ncbi:MAG TPA: GNAT family N-acetyltransferase [Xanthobacteraceae bacterium]|nr:GNAT family N-acetyltransferase [Xanthobacteraceae bacterium]